jgi:hypothetical protein
MNSKKIYITLFIRCKILTIYEGERSTSNSCHFTLGERCTQFPLKRTLGWPHNWSGWFGWKKKSLLTQQRIEPWFFSCSTCSPVTILTTYVQSFNWFSHYSLFQSCYVIQKGTEDNTACCQNIRTDKWNVQRQRRFMGPLKQKFKCCNLTQYQEQKQSINIYTIAILYGSAYLYIEILSLVSLLKPQL